ncbi:MAG: GNAT family N-acetyltransferase [Cereibacter sphaeroides]|uniref:GNAT family N-acetyltransferase n=1 Tax=Cereibacter sphaeroides TaxID=1063 RepID=A0A2W5RYA4_CERSP|nr:MAG: GNAT family N-acetyltransferase [Cereibacter sphaeroides]
MASFTVKALSEATWPDFARLIEAHNGVWGGCWCIGFHEKGTGTAEGNRDAKLTRVREGRAHAALVYDGEDCVGWCQFGRLEELPRIKYRKAYEAGQPGPPDWRITCFFTDKHYRGKGVAAAALSGALEEIAKAGGGRVESSPENAEGRKVAGAFLFNATLGTFESQGFRRVKPLGKHAWLVEKVV